MAVQLVTFGGLHVLDDSGEVERLLTQRSRAALFIYLAVERRVSREALTAMFWPESDAEGARHALRQSLYHLRKAVGSDWLDSRAHELAVRAEVRVDATEFADALARGDPGAAVRLYRGPFLAGVHLVDLRPWESWVDGRRAQYARAFRKASRDLLDARRAAGDLAGAVAVAERWVAGDPSDDEAQHRLIEALATAGERAEALRQYEAYARMLEPDGLEPLDETRALVECLRTDAAPLPALRPVAAAGPEPAASAAPVTATTGPVAREATAAGRPPRRALGLAAAAAALVAVLGGAWTLLAARDARQPAPSTTAVAVLPFAVRGGQGAQYLGEGIVSLLGTALDGAGSLRPVDARATFTAVAGEGGGAPDPERGARIASRLGAGMFVLGDVVEAGGTIQVEAAAYDVGAGCRRWLRRASVGATCPLPPPSSRAVVSGPADSVFALVDALAARLLGGLGDPAADRLTRAAAVTTASLPAFKAYLRGEAEFRAGRFERAADAFLEAISLDSTFAVAHYRLALAREWAPLPANAEAADAAARHAARLSTRDRMLLEAFQQWRTGDGPRADRSYRTILARYPDDFDAWFQLGEVQFHRGPLLGQAVEESEAAWRRVLAYDSRSLFALTHLARIAATTGRLDALDSVLARFGPEQLRTDRRLEELAVLRTLARGDSAAALALAREVRRGEPFAVWRVAVFLTAFAPRPALMRSVLDELMTDFPDPHLRADLHFMGAALDLAGGRLAAARAGLARAAESERGAPADRRRSGFADVTEWYVATLPLPFGDSTLARVRARAASAPAAPARARGPFDSELGLGRTIRHEPLRQYTLGTLALRLRDTTAAASAAARLAELAAGEGASPLVRDMSRGLGARLAWQRGRASEALRLLGELELRDIQGDIAVTPFATRAGERYLRGEILVSQGRDAEALRWFASLGVGSVTEVPLRAPSHLRRAEIHDRLGQRAEAARHYARFVELWQDADPELQGHVAAARQRLSALARQD